MQLSRRPNEQANHPQISSLLFPTSSYPLSHDHAHHLRRCRRISLLLSSHFSCVHQSLARPPRAALFRACQACPISSETPITHTFALHLRRPNEQTNLLQISSLLFPPSSSPLTHDRPPSPPLPPPLHFIPLELPLFSHSIILRRGHHA
jgi:hypothetical protein